MYFSPWECKERISQPVSFLTIIISCFNRRIRENQKVAALDFFPATWIFHRHYNIMSASNTAAHCSFKTKEAPKNTKKGIEISVLAIAVPHKTKQSSWSNNFSICLLHYSFMFFTMKNYCLFLNCYGKLINWWASTTFKPTFTYWSLLSFYSKFY